MVTQERKRFGDRASSAANEVLNRPVEMVQEYPLSSMLIVFSAGLGLGVVIGQALIPSFHEPTMTERMGRQLYDSMCSLSNAVSRPFHS